MFEGITVGDKDFSALIAKMKRENVDFVYFGGYHPEMGALLRQSAENGFAARFMGPEGVGNTDITAIAGQAAEGMLTTLPKAFDEDPANAGLVQAFRDSNLDPSGAFVFPAYAAVQVIADAMKLTNSTDPQVIADALRNNSFDTPTGTLEFQANGDLKEFSFVVYEWHADNSKTALTE